MYFTTLHDCAEFCIYWHEAGYITNSEEVDPMDLQNLMGAMEDLSNATGRDLLTLTPEQAKACQWCYDHYKFLNADNIEEAENEHC